MEILKNTIEKVKVPDRLSALAFLTSCLSIGSTKGISQQGKEKIVTHYLSTKLLPHLGTGGFSHIAKGHFIASMAKKLALAYLQGSGHEDRDHLGRKRVDMAGDLMLQMFMTAFRSFMGNAKILL